MKKFKFNRDVLYTCLGISIFLFLYAAISPEAILDFTKLSWLFLIFAFIIIFTPLGNATLFSDKNSNSHLLTWFGKIISLQLLLCLAFFGFAYSFIPYFFNERINNVTEITLHTMTFHWGLFPWALYGLLVAVLVKIKSSHPIKNIGNIFTFQNPNIKLVMNVWFLQSLFWVSTFSIATLTLLLVKNLSDLVPLYFLSGPTFNVLIIAIALLMIPGTQRFARITQNLWRRHTSLTKSILISVIFLSFFLIIINIFIVLLSRGVFKPIPYTNIIYSILNDHAQTIWLLTVWSWWLAWAPLIAHMIYSFSHSKSIRTILIGSLFLPCIVAVMIYKNWDESVITYFSNLQISHATALFNRFFWPLISLFSLLFLMRYKKIFEQSILLNFSAVSITEHERLPLSSSRGLLQSVFIAAACGIIGGVVFLYMLSMAFILQLLIIFLAAVGVFCFSKFL